jgi:hypothetical protein
MESASWKGSSHKNLAERVEVAVAQFLPHKFYFHPIFVPALT